MTHTQSPLGNQSERNTSCVDSLISDKPNSKAEEMRRCRCTCTCLCKRCEKRRGREVIQNKR